MKILVVGASGFIGKNLLLNFPKNWEIYGTYNKSNEFLNFIEEKKLRNVQPIKCDLEKNNEVKNVIEKHYFDVCVYLAADTNVRALTENPVDDVKNNILPILNFLQYFKGKKLIYFSSGAVYMGLSGEISPDSNINPSIPYAISKYTCEQYIKFYQSYKKTFEEYIILRFFGAYGKYEPKRKITTKLIEMIHENKKEFIVFGDGKNYIDFMYIDDAVNGVIQIINSDKGNLTVDFCSGNPMTINELIKKVGKIFGIEINIKHEGNSPEYITFYANPKKMFQLFNFKPKISLEEGYKKFAKQMKNK